MTFWERLEKALTENNITEAELSRRIGFSQAGINGWKTKGSLPRVDIALKTANILKTSVEYLVNGTIDTKAEKTSNLFLIPVLNQELSAGKGEVLPENDVVKGIVSLPYSLIKQFGKNLVALFVHGDSMQPTLFDGDMIICDTLGYDNSDGVFALRMNGNGYVKRIQVGNGKIYIMSDNSKYKTIEEPIESDNYQIIGKVRLIIHSV